MRSRLSELCSQIVRVEAGMGEDTRCAVLLASLVYDAADPYAVRMTIQQARGPVTWIFARQLLAAGLDGVSGRGDVEVRSEGEDTVVIWVGSPSGQNEMRIPRDGVQRFLDATEDIVPLGGEAGCIDWDPVIARLLGGVADA